MPGLPCVLPKRPRVDVTPPVDPPTIVSDTCDLNFDWPDTFEPVAAEQFVATRESFVDCVDLNCEDVYDFSELPCIEHMVPDAPAHVANFSADAVIGNGFA